MSASVLASVHTSVHTCRSWNALAPGLISSSSMAGNKIVILEILRRIRFSQNSWVWTTITEFASVDEILSNWSLGLNFYMKSSPNGAWTWISMWNAYQMESRHQLPYEILTRWSPDTSFLFEILTKWSLWMNVNLIFLPSRTWPSISIWKSYQMEPRHQFLYEMLTKWSTDIKTMHGPSLSHRIHVFVGANSMVDKSSRRMIFGCLCLFGTCAVRTRCKRCKS